MEGMKLMERLRAVRLEKERVAVSLLSLSFFVVLYTFAALSSPPAWRPAFGALALCYGVAFLALASQWFWARWFASGLAWSGTTLGIVSLVMVGWHPILALYGGLHALVLGMLAGPNMAAHFEMQAPWRERYAMDEFAVARLRRVVTRASTALPSLILWALAPREGQGAWLISGLAMGCDLAGLAGILRLRTWGVLSLGVSAFLTLMGAVSMPLSSPAVGGWVGTMSWEGSLRPGVVFSALLMSLAIVPVAGALRRAWRSWF
jgi:hypothetical protein